MVAFEHLFKRSYLPPQTPKQEENYKEAAKLVAEREKIERAHEAFYLMEQVA
jgi:hypothetical protein